MYLVQTVRELLRILAYLLVYSREPLQTLAYLLKYCRVLVANSRELSACSSRILRVFSRIRVFAACSFCVLFANFRVFAAYFLRTRELSRICSRILGYSCELSHILAYSLAYSRVFSRRIFSRVFPTYPRIDPATSALMQIAPGYTQRVTGALLARGSSPGPIHLHSPSSLS